MANERARALRKALTPQEVKLWVHLRSWRKRGFHFRRQAPRQAYIIDFVCLRHRLIIEVDGGQHNEMTHAARDQERDIRLASEGFKVLRFWNNEINENLDGVLETINAELMRRTPTRPRASAHGHPPPQAGEG